MSQCDVATHRHTQTQISNTNSDCNKNKNITSSKRKRMISFFKKLKLLHTKEGLDLNYMYHEDRMRSWNYYQLDVELYRKNFNFCILYI